MILKALYDYYHRCGSLPAKGLELKEIGFLIVIDKEGHFLRFEDCRIDNGHALSFLVKKHVGRSSAAVANYLYDNSAYVFGFSDKDKGKEQLYFDTFKKKTLSICEAFPEDESLKAISSFYNQTKEQLIEQLSADPLWDEVTKSLTKKYANFSFRLDGDTEIVAQKRNLLQLDEEKDSQSGDSICLITGNRDKAVEVTTATMIPGSQAIAKLVSFQVGSGYDSYGKTKCYNAPIGEEAEFSYTTALNHLLNSRNKSSIGNRTFVFWASAHNNEIAEEVEDSLFDFLDYKQEKTDDPNANVDKVKKVFEDIYSGKEPTTSDDKFYILGLAPNSARIAVVYWSEISLKDFASKILRHFNDMKICDTRKVQSPYSGVRQMLSATLRGKPKDLAPNLKDVTPNLPEAVVKSVFEGLPYPYTLFSSCIRRIRAERSLTIARVAILKAYLNRLNNDHNKSIEIMLDKENTNAGYLCGRLFAVLENLQYAANRQDSIRSSYMNAASSNPSAVFPTILKLSNTHFGKLAKDKRGLAFFYDGQKQEIISAIHEFPDSLNLADQARFFLGYYHQKNYKEEKQTEAETAE